MARLHVSVERPVGAPADVAYECISDHEQHARFLPPAFSDFEVESGGVGAGTITRFKVTTAGRTRAFRMRVDEPEPGRVLTESDTESSLVTTWTVTPDGDDSRVAIATEWEGAGGIGGFFERLFAPPALRRLYTDELQRLDAYARERASHV